MPSVPTDESIRSRPNRVPWPPVILMTGIVIGWLAAKILPTLVGVAMTGQFPLGMVQAPIGWLLVVLAIAMDVWVLMIFRSAHTNIRPDRPARHLVTTGPFTHSRNPIYVGNVAIILGLALAKGSLWYLLLVPLVFYCIQELAIKREEAHMAARFGESWDHYAASVRRWL